MILLLYSVGHFDSLTSLLAFLKIVTGVIIVTRVMTIVRTMDVSIDASCVCVRTVSVIPITILSVAIVFERSLVEVVLKFIELVRNQTPCIQENRYVH